jgi:nucleotide-binding universal stress UspA family protein
MSEQNVTEAPAVAVGVDGSPSSWQAIHAAAWEARARRLTVLLVNGYPADPYTWYGWAPLYAGPAFDSRQAAEAMVGETANEVRSIYPDLIVDTVVHAGTGAHALITVAHTAMMVVVGSRGGGGFAGLSIGSVAAQTAAHAACPVLVIRPPAEQIESEPPAATTVVPRPVLVGVDGSPASEAAIEFAFQEASLRHVPLIAMHVWWESPTHTVKPGLPGAPNLVAAREESKRLLTKLTSDCAKKYPDVSVDLRAVESMNPSHALIEASDEAGLVIVGSRGRGGFAGLLLGSTGRDLVGHANSPVAVVRPRHPA